jgi:hypothetical protein
MKVTADVIIFKISSVAVPYGGKTTKKTSIT